MFQKSININNSSPTTKLIFAFMIVGFFIFVNNIMKNQAYKLSLTKLENHDEVAFYLGTPIKAGYFVTGESGTKETEINYSISGPLNSADVYLYAQVINGNWVIQDLEVTVDGINKRINALDLP